MNITSTKPSNCENAIINAVLHSLQPINPKTQSMHTESILFIIIHDIYYLYKNNRIDQTSKQSKQQQNACATCVQQKTNQIKKKNYKLLKYNIIFVLSQQNNKNLQNYRLSIILQNIKNI